ncbi:MAG: helix-turn-helix transcriptional regulator [Methylocystaceae bacterium]|nr:helix-turn-helix transcriptional regulator [Methylocystaceae bacterium]
MTIRINLDVIMAQRQMRLKDLAQQVGITEANLSILKTQKAKAVRFSTLDMLCKVLSCEPGDILKYESDEDGQGKG